ncbi:MULTISPECIES: hypothetical protein [unclassified Chryseobacterium]|uniref:hypothetical protein n=1 Tax=unclassified Chryseobacterium TaxID=2593645 RepID=UPI000F464558|nr:hypothetical protein [Chryseobacterium sp. BIGb0232]MCS4300673.1 hypothetical protein [Chryseobacterium sp. BIGb0232]ROS20445.1 hypothetical protein EDF65_1166 [Chryseobacterium nakagawai]
MNTIKISVDIKQTESILLFTITVHNFSEKIIYSNISDDSGGFTRRTVNLYDEHQNKVHRGVNYISPTTYTENVIAIETGATAQFVIPAKLEEMYDELFLNFRGANFNVTQNKTYYFQMEYFGSTSDMIPFKIN